MSSYLDLKKAIENFSNDSKENLEQVDYIFNEIIKGNQNDILPSLGLIEDFLISTLDGQNKTLKVA